jgi:hypothetical protein
MRITRTVLSLVLCGSVGLVACGGGGDSGGGARSTPAAYVDAVCGGLSDIIAKAGAAQTAFDGATSDPAKVKADVTSLIGGMSGAVDKAVSSIEKVGAPKVTDGEKGHTALLGALKSMQSGLKEVEAAAAALDVTSSSSAAGFAAVAEKFATAMDSIGEGLEGLENEELAKAAANSEACKKMGAN